MIAVVSMTYEFNYHESYVFKTVKGIKRKITVFIEYVQVVMSCKMKANLY